MAGFGHSFSVCWIIFREKQRTLTAGGLVNGSDRFKEKACYKVKEEPVMLEQINLMHNLKNLTK